MKTSTINAVITGICTIIAGIIGIVSYSIGGNTQNDRIEATINQSGVIAIIQNENSTDTIQRLLDEYVNLQNNYTCISDEYMNLKEDYKVIETKNAELLNRIDILKTENEVLSNRLNIEETIENNEIPQIQPDQYLFDNEPYMFEHINLMMRNNDRNTIFQTNTFSYSPGFRMVSNGENYEKGMAITPQSSAQATLFYNLKGEYSNLLGAIAFEDKYSDRVDRNYNIFFYCDDKYIDKVTITKGNLPAEFAINIAGCNVLKIVLERPEGDNSRDPNINLLEWKLYK